MNWQQHLGMITVHRLNFILKQSIIYTGDDVPMSIKELNITDSNKPLISVIIPVYNIYNNVYVVY